MHTTSKSADAKAPICSSTLALAIATVIASAALVGPVQAKDRHDRYQRPFCSTTAKLVRSACSYEGTEDWLTARASCLNVSDRRDRRECYAEAREERAESRELCGDQLHARLEVCDTLGEGRYDPDFDADNFVDPNEIGVSVEPNPYLPLVPGNRWVYEAEDETVIVVVTDRIKLIDGVRCRVVNDVVREEGRLVEDTDDWFAQDLDGNVWYCGEEVKDYAFFDGDEPSRAELVDIDGSFKIGRDGARAGILVLANPQPGDSYRQEFLIGEAEDVVEVVSITGTESAPAATCNNRCLVTRDFSPLDPEANENKYYVAGTGLILEVDLTNGDRLELVEFSRR